MKITDHIGVFDNGVPIDLCTSIMDSFNLWEGNREFIGPCFKDGDKQMKEGHFARSDVQMCLEVVEADLAKRLNSYIRKSFDEYVSVYRGLTQNTDPLSSWTIKVQKTVAGGGYHQWHYEDGQFICRDRVLAWMVYLNSIPVKNGGATEFLHQKLALHPTGGTIVLWPAAYTHIHRGGFLTGEVPKFIATGWFLREPGQPTRDYLNES
tara:strand:- start:590 stop:1213 length:624 start_codon:yes stop_codon:yes gene_type:complete